MKYLIALVILIFSTPCFSKSYLEESTLRLYSLDCSPDHSILVLSGEDKYGKKLSVTFYINDCEVFSEGKSVQINHFEKVVY